MSQILRPTPSTSNIILSVLDNELGGVDSSADPIFTIAKGVWGEGQTNKERENGLASGKNYLSYASDGVDAMDIASLRRCELQFHVLIFRPFR